MSSIWELRRSATDAKLSGLCGAVAARWGVDPTLVRVGWAVLALSGGIGVVLYLAGWFLLPVQGRDTAPVDDLLGEQARSWPREVWLAIVVVLSIAVLAVAGTVTPFGFGSVLILGLIWYFGYYKNRPVKAPTPPAVAPPPPPPSTYTGPPTPFTEAAQVWQQRVAEQSHAEQSHQERTFYAHPDPVGLYVEPPPAVPQPRSRAALPSARRLRLTALSVLGLVLTGLGTADYLGARVPAVVYLAAALLVVGLTLVAATWLGRARGILPVGLLLAVVVVGTTAASTLTAQRDWGSADRVYATAAQIPPAGDRWEVGQLQVDLTDLPVQRDLTYRAQVDLGSLEVAVPPGAAVRLRYQLGGGGIVRAYGQDVADGSHEQGVIDPPNLRPGTPVLTLDLTVDHGQIEVKR
ncbi:MAG: PspC domain-containing protein [Actinomycetes bacterium]